MSMVPPSLIPPPSAQAQYDLAFQISPIILQGGIVASVQGGMQPISAITTPKGGEPFARYLPMPGSTLLAQSVGMYPFANQAVAGNATILQPLVLSMLMIAPVNQPGGYLAKLPIFSALQQALKNHNASGGTYIVATPACIYRSLLLTAMTDMSAEDSRQKQIQWQLDFIAPIITLQDAAAIQGTLYSKITGGGKIGVPSYSGQQNASPADLPGITAALATFGGTL